MRPVGLRLRPRRGLDPPTRPQPRLREPRVHVALNGPQAARIVGLLCQPPVQHHQVDRLLGSLAPRQPVRNLLVPATGQKRLLRTAIHRARSVAAPVMFRVNYFCR